MAEEVQLVSMWISPASTTASLTLGLARVAWPELRRGRTVTLVTLLTGLTLQTRSPQVAHSVALGCNG